jgi:hypothetical protein
MPSEGRSAGDRAPVFRRKDCTRASAPATLLSFFIVVSCLHCLDACRLCLQSDSCKQLHHQSHQWRAD